MIMDISKKDIVNLNKVRACVVIMVDQDNAPDQTKEVMKECIESLDKTIKDLEHRLHMWETV